SPVTAAGGGRSPAVVNVEDIDNAAVLIDPVDDAVGAAPGAVTASKRPEQRLAAEGSPLARHRRTPAWQRQQLLKAAGQSLAARQARTGSHTAAQVRSSRDGVAALGQILENRGNI